MPVVLIGMKDTLEGLSKFDQDAKKKFNSVVNAVLNEAKTEAMTYVPDLPMRNWQTKPSINPNKKVRGGKGWPAWDPEQVKAGIRASKAKGKVRGDYTTSAGALINKDPAGAIFEIAGRKSDDSKSKSGQQFKQNLKKFGSASRVVWRAVDRNKQIFDARIAKATEEAKQDLQKALEKQKTEN
jgi:hypothetical protein